MMTYNEIERVLQINGNESHIYLPNDIFEELKVIENVQHRAFAYSYIYLITWLWRNAKYGSLEYEDMTQNKFMKILGKKGNTRLRYITSKKGILEEIKYLETQKDFPLYARYDSHQVFSVENDENICRELGDGMWFNYMSEYDDVPEVFEYNRPPANYEVKKPIRGYHRNILDPEWTEEYEQGGYEDGTFFQYENTHEIPIEVFMYCMSKKEVGEKGFYIYAFLKSRGQLFNDVYDTPMKKLSKDLGMPDKTTQTWLKITRQYNMIQGLHNQDAFVVGLPKEKRKANSYIINEYKLFSDKPIEYTKMKVMKRNVYLEKTKQEKKMQEENDKKMRGERIPLDQLPY
ncbi:hypothetical protein ACQCPP_12405 [Priestia megaterium]|uniref:hypothetical protein n=1 Tax=Priestia megaterium TaxID=1404 RepID=UPI003D03E576